MTIRWIWAFLDRPAAQFDECARFWTAVTDTRLSPARGENSEFVTLLPDSGSPTVKMQAVASGTRVHMDLDVDDVRAAAGRAVTLGASVVLEHPVYTVLRSPHGMIFCFTPAQREPGERSPATAGPGGEISRLDQICLDIGPSDHADEVRFWTELTGWTMHSSTLPEYSRLRPDSALPIGLLLQRLGTDRPTSAHVDLACTDIEATAAWHQRLGATRVEHGKSWIVMTDPAGQPYCLTGREPS
ncbi:VOC family protein [Nocardia sp. NPDC057668]|uniref:VOC family protein n=1 Tax=Nocardia sp. NPDC057668 TaxID=3346202 RepID=UPI00366FABF7